MEFSIDYNVSKGGFYLSQIGRDEARRLRDILISSGSIGVKGDKFNPEKFFRVHYSGKRQVLIIMGKGKKTKRISYFLAIIGMG